MFSKSPEKYFSLRSSQSSRSGKSSIAKIAVTSSKTVRETPPVLTFSKTWQTASLGVSLSNRITGIAYFWVGMMILEKSSVNC